MCFNFIFNKQDIGLQLLKFLFLLIFLREIQNNQTCESALKENRHQFPRELSSPFRDVAMFYKEKTKNEDGTT